MCTIIHRGLQENEGRDCAVPIYEQTNLILSSHYPHDLTFLTSSSLWQVLTIFPMPCHSLRTTCETLAATHAAPGVTAHKSKHITVNK